MVPRKKLGTDCQWHRCDGVIAFILAPSQPELFQVLFAQWLLSAQTVGHQRDLGKVLDRLHLHVGVVQRVRVGHDAMV